MKWNLLVASCLVVVTILLMAGAPLLPVAFGIVLAALWCWSRYHAERRASAGSQ